MGRKETFFWHLNVRPVDGPVGSGVTGRQRQPVADPEGGALPSFRVTKKKDHISAEIYFRMRNLRPYISNFHWGSCPRTPLEHHSKHEALTQCCSNVGPPSSTSAQHYNNIGPMPRVSWEVPAAVCINPYKNRRPPIVNSWMRHWQPLHQGSRRQYRGRIAPITWFKVTYTLCIQLQWLN